VRFAGWFCLVLGAAFIVAAGVLGALTIRQATEITAYHQARACRPGAALNADCLQQVHGAVAAVTEFPGGYRIGANYSLDVRTSSTALHLTFTSDSPMLGYAVDGNPAVVTMWRGVPVSVETDGRSQVTASVSATALARDLGNGEESGGIGVFLAIGALAIRRSRRAGGVQPATRPAQAATLLAVVLSALALGIGGIALEGKPSRLGPDLTATGAALAVVTGLSVWLWFSAKRRASRVPASLTQRHAMNSDADVVTVPVTPALWQGRATRTAHRTRMHPANWARVLRAVVAGWLAPSLTAAVLFGVFLTSRDGPAARAYRHAVACVGETNLDTCLGDFTAVINGVRSPANGANGADVSYATQDGGINTWTRFGGDSAAITRMASADENAHALLRIKVWRGSIVGAELGGSWQWAWDNPPGNTIPTVFLSVSFALLLLVVRMRIHRRARSGVTSQRLLVDDGGQVASAAGSVALLSFGFLPGAVVALVTLAWLGLSARQRPALRASGFQLKDASR